MIRPIPVCWGVLLFAAAGAVVITSRDALRARGQAEASVRELATVTELAEELITLRADRPVPKTASTGLSPRVSGALARCGLPASALASFSPEAGDARTGRQRAVITLATPTLNQVGAFLAEWREAEPDWVVSSVELAPMLGVTPQPGADLPLRTVIGIESTAPVGRGGEP